MAKIVQECQVQSLANLQSFLESFGQSANVLNISKVAVKMLKTNLWYRRTFRIDEIIDDLNSLMNRLNSCRTLSRGWNKLISKIATLQSELNVLEEVTGYHGSVSRDYTTNKPNVITKTISGIVSVFPRFSIILLIYVMLIFFLFPFILPGYWLPWSPLHRNVETHPSRTTRLDRYPRVLVELKEGDKNLPLGWTVVDVDK